MIKTTLPDSRYFDPDPAQSRVTRQLYQQVADLPLVCPHGHVDPSLFADPQATFGSPADLLIIPDHYVYRMLYSHGIPLETLGISGSDQNELAPDHRQIWQTFAEHFYLFRGTPTGLWLREELAGVFGIHETLNGKNAQAIYDQIDQSLQLAEFRPRNLFKRFNIEVLCTTDAATDSLDFHQRINESDWTGRIRPTFRPDTVVNIDTPGWSEHIANLSTVSGVEVVDYRTFVAALEQRRAFFKKMGATATDHAALTAYTGRLSTTEADQILSRALNGRATAEDATRFTGHMLIEMARMSTGDGLVMQLHVGSFRNHNRVVFERFGWDKGADIPLRSEFTQNLRPLLDQFGNDPQLTLILFNLDETTYARELAPLAGHYPAVKLGPPWWFHDSLNGIRRYFDQVMETAGLYNTVGFNDDTRAFLSIPARHDLWRRTAADWVAGLVIRHIVSEDEGLDMVRALAYDLARQAYKLDQ